MLAGGEKGAVTIDHIVPNGPAADSEIMEGDTLAKVGERVIQDPQSFVEVMEEMDPGDEVQLSVLRDGEPLTIAVTLGSLSDAPMAFLRRLQPDRDMDALEGIQDNSSGNQLTDLALDELRRQLRDLRDEVRELKRQRAGQAVDANRAKQVNAIEQSNYPHGTQAIQFQSRGAHRDGYSSRGNAFRHYNYRPSGQRYQSQFGQNRATPYRGQPYYYRRGGRPYYYSGGNGYWYGNRPRTGVQIGPNLGVYWY